MDENAKELTKRSAKRFADQSALDTYRQEIALNFAPDLAEFTDELVWGEDFAAHLMDGTPLLLARDYNNQIGAMLRPKGKYWARHRIAGSEEANEQKDIRSYLDWRTEQMHRVMTDRVTGFERAAKGTDRFYGLFGDACMSIDISDMQDSLRFNYHHTKDVVWALGKDNTADTITRKESWPARIQIAKFGKENVHPKIKDAATKDPDKKFPVEHHVLPAADYEFYSKKFKDRDGFASIWVDAEHNKILRETPQQTKRYVIPIAEMVKGWPYGFSQATMVALPDARLIQQQALVLYEAAEKSANPPLVAYEDAIRGDVQLMAGGITWAERQYDERTGQPVTPLDLGKNFPLSIDALLRTEQQLAKAFYLDVLRLPDTRSSKSVEEIQFRIDEYVRSAIPLFAPMHDAYNNAMLHEVDAMIELAGGYEEMDRPEGLDPEMMTFAWDNPLSDMMERQKAVRVSEVAQIGATIAGLKAAAAQTEELQRTDFDKMYEESMMGIGAADWLLSEGKYKKKKQAHQEAMMQQQARDEATQLAPVLKDGAQAAKDLGELDLHGSPGFAMPLPQ